MRLLIDCSFIDFSRQPTGIPRVVLKYIEEGYEWSRKADVEVIPVVTTPTGVLPVRPTPGNNPPAYARAAAEVLGPDWQSHPSAKGHIDAAAFQLQAFLAELGLPLIAHECNAAARQAIQNTVDRAVSEQGAEQLPVEHGDILFCPAYWHDVPPINFKRLQGRGVRIATLVHDILPVTYAKFYQAPWKYQFEKALVEAIRHSEWLIAVSQYTADSIVEFAARKGLGRVDVRVSHNGFDELIPPEMRRAIEEGDFTPLVRRRSAYEMLRHERPFLMVGTLEPKKGHIPTVRSFEAMWDAGLERPLVVIGRKGWMERSVVDAVRQSRYFMTKLFWFDDFDDLDLFFAYRHSRGLIFSSYAEGFGIPMIEALKAGCPVVALDTPITREVSGHHATFFSSFAELAKAVIRLDDDEGYAEAKAAIQDFSWPSWREITTSLFDDFTTYVRVEEPLTA